MLVSASGSAEMKYSPGELVQFKASMRKARLKGKGWINHIFQHGDVFLSVGSAEFVSDVQFEGDEVFIEFSSVGLVLRSAKRYGNKRYKQTYFLEVLFGEKAVYVEMCMVERYNAKSQG